MIWILAPLFERIRFQKVAVRDLKSGDEIVFDDGGKRVVREARWGEGLITFQRRMARVVIIDFADGGSMPAHPREPVRISKKR